MELDEMQPLPLIKSKKPTTAQPKFLISAQPDPENIVRSNGSKVLMRSPYNQYRRWSNRSNYRLKFDLNKLFPRIRF